MAQTTYIAGTVIQPAWLNDVDVLTYGAKAAASVVVNITALRLLSKLIITRAFTQGYYTSGDTGGAQYNYDSTDTTSPDDGGSVIVAADGGRWKLVRNAGITVRQFGAKGDGTTDDTASIQAAITYARSFSGVQSRLFWNYGVYKVTATLTFGTSQWVDFEPGVTVNAILDVNTPLFSCAAQTGLYLYGNGATLNGNRAAVTLTNNGNQTAFYLYGTKNFCIKNFVINNFGFDSITLTGDTTGSGACTNGTIDNCIVSSSGRNGVSIIHADTVTIQGGLYSASNGTPSGPWAGIDIEPNGNGQYVKNIQIHDVKTSSNNGAGIQVTPSQMSSTVGLECDVTVTGWRSTNDGLASTGSTGHAACKLVNGGGFTNEVLGQITFRDSTIEGPNAMGMSLFNWDALLAPRILLDNIQVINPNNNSASTGTPNQCGFVIYCDSAQTNSLLGKFVAINCKAQDNRVSPKMQVGFYLAADSGKTIQDIRITDFTAINYLSALKYPVKTDLLSAGTFVDVVVSYTNPKPVSAGTSITDPGFGGQRINFTAASSLTLPLAAKCKGLYYEVQADQAAGGSCFVIRSGSDVIKALGVSSVTSHTLQQGDIARYRSEGGTFWSVSAIS